MGKSTKQDELRPKRRRVRIDIGGQDSWMDETATQDPAITALVLPQLEYDLKVTEEGGPRGYQEHQERINLHGLRLDRQGAFPTGLVPRVMRVLTDHGYSVNVVDHRDYGTPRFQIDKEFLRRRNREDRRFANTIRREPVGQIEVKDFADMILAMRLIIDMYPKARVLIPVATKEMARKVHVKLDTVATDFPVRIIGREWPKTTWRCAACTFQAINTCPTEEYDIILLPEALRTTSDTGAKALRRFVAPYDRKVWRTYSFIQRGLRLGRRERIHLEAISGELIYRLAPEHAGVRVFWLPTPSCIPIPKDATALTFKRKAYWHNDRRNDYIAAAARAFMRQDLEKLRKYGVPFEGDKPALRHVPHPKLVLLAASTEQARELKKRLPEWEVLSAVPGRETDEEESQGKIVTEMWATQKGLDADVVIRAGGGSGTLCLKGLPPALEGEERRDGLVVDFEDGFDVRAVREAKRRMSGYEALGWRPLSEQKTVQTEPPQR